MEPVRSAEGGVVKKWLGRIVWMVIGAALFFILTLPAGPSAGVNQLAEWVRGLLRSALHALSGAVG